jgi:hypothetical protein
MDDRRERVGWCTDGVLEEVPDSSSSQLGLCVSRQRGSELLTVRQLVDIVLGERVDNGLHLGSPSARQMTVG